MRVENFTLQGRQLMIVEITKMQIKDQARHFAYKATRTMIENKGVKVNDKIIIKPNITYPKPPSTGVTTHHEIVMGVLDALQEFNNVFLVESDATSSDFGENVMGWGDDFLTDYPNAELVNLSILPRRTEKLSGNHRTYNVALPEFLMNYDILINLPVLKTHILTGVSMGMKNLFGLLPEKNKSHYHLDIHDFILAINDFFQPDLTILDGIEGLEGQGPLFGEPAKLRVVLSSTNVVAIDAIGAKMMNFNPKNIDYLNSAIKKYLGGNISQIQIKGDYFISHFRRTPLLIKQLVQLLLGPGDTTIKTIQNEINLPAQTIDNLPILLSTLVDREILGCHDKKFYFTAKGLVQLSSQFPEIKEDLNLFYDRNYIKSS